LTFYLFRNIFRKANQNEQLLFITNKRIIHKGSENYLLPLKYIYFYYLEEKGKYKKMLLRLTV